MAKLKLADGTEIEAFTQQELDEQLSGLKHKVSELLDETKAEKEKRRSLEQQREDLEKEQQRKNGEFEKLYQSTQQELDSEREKARLFMQKIQQKDLDSASLSLVSSLTKDMKRAELLKKEAMQYAKYTEDGVVYEIGGITVTKEKLIDKLKADYPFLCDGSGATGGGAIGSNGGGAAKKASEYTEAERVDMYRNNRELFNQTFK